MSIASQIQRLQNAKASIKESIENKGVEVPNNALIDTYSNYIDNISTGITIQNGRIENYKSYDENIPSGTFVKFKSLMTSSSLRSLISTSNFVYFQNIIKMSDNRAVIIGLFNSNYLSINLVEINDNNIRFINKLGLTSYSISNYMQPLCVKLDDNHIAFCWDKSPMIIHVYSFENDNITLVSSSTQSINGKCNKDINVIEDNDYYYVIASSVEADSVTGNFHVCFKIDKSTYEITSKYMLSSNGCDLYVGNNTLKKDNYIYEIRTDYRTHYTYISAITTDGTTLTETLNEIIQPRVYFAKLIERRGRYFIIYSTTDDFSKLEYQELSLNNNNVNVIKSGVLLEDTSSIFIDNYVTCSNIDTENLLLYKKSTNGAVYTRVISLVNNELVLGDEIAISDTSIAENPSAPRYFRQYNAIKLNQNILISYIDSIGIYKIIDNKVNSVTGDGIVVEKTTGLIQGLTKTDITPSTSGEVYVLDTTI